MMSRKSTPPPTAADLERMELCKAIGCVPCRIDLHVSRVDVEYNHIVRGGVRAGHQYGYCACRWHHRGVAFTTAALMAEAYGPSMALNKRAFHERYGTDQQLLDRQNDLLGVPRVTIPTKRAPSANVSKRTKHQNGRSAASTSKNLPRRY